MNPAPSEPPDQTRARVKTPKPRPAPDYTPEFEVLWVGCDKQGLKSTALIAWREVGSPDPVDVAATWKRYRASIPVDQQPKHVSSWLRAYGHEQEWPSRAEIQKALRPAENYARREEREREERRLDARADLILGRG
jgi:hypothetical protein